MSWLQIKDKPQSFPLAIVLGLMFPSLTQTLQRNIKYTLEKINKLTIYVIQTQFELKIKQVKY